MKFFNLLLLSSVSVALISCDTKRNPYFGDDDAQFAVASVADDLESADGDDKPKPLGEAEFIDVMFKACLKTLAGEPIPPGLQFQVKNKSNETQTDKTNLEGCIQWRESHRRPTVLDEVTLRLPRTIVSENEYNGKREIIIYWNLFTKKFSSNINNKKIPNRTQDPIENTFSMKNPEITVQNSGSVIQGSGTGTGTVTPGTTGTPGTTPVRPTENENLLPEQQPKKARLVLTEIDLARVKLDQESPYKVDKNLTLYTNHTFQVSAAPKYYVNTLDNPDKEVNPPGGKYKITLVFMDDPHVDLEKLAVELNTHQTLEAIKKSQTPEARKLRLAADVLVANKTLTPAPQLTVAAKKQILHKILVGLVHSTAQFIADKKAEQDIKKFINLEIKKLAKLDVRSILAVTVESVSEGQSQKFKGHGVGYVSNLLEPGSVTLLQTPIEADQIFSEYQAVKALNEKLLPVDLFLQASHSQLKQKALRNLNLEPLSTREFMQSIHPNGYPFKQEFNSYLKGLPEGYQLNLFQRSICNKLFNREDLKVIEKNPKYPDEQRLIWTFRCHSGNSIRSKYYSINVMDFVENVDQQKVTKAGQSITETISISRSLEKSMSKSSAQGHKIDGSIGDPRGEIATYAANYLIDGIILGATMINPVVGTVLSFARARFPFSAGGSWYWATTSETGTGKSGKISKDSSVEVKVNIDTYRISNIETRRCAIISYEPWVVDYFAKQYNISLHKGYFACAESKARPVYYEKYYMVTQECSEKNGTTDCSSDEENKLRMVLRGDVPYKMFNDMVTSANLNVLLEPVSSEALEKQRMSLVNFMDSIQTSQVFPGVLIPDLTPEKK